MKTVQLLDEKFPACKDNSDLTKRGNSIHKKEINGCIEDMVRCIRFGVETWPAMKEEYEQYEDREEDWEKQQKKREEERKEEEKEEEKKKKVEVDN